MKWELNQKRKQNRIEIYVEFQNCNQKSEFESITTAIKTIPWEALNTRATIWTNRIVARSSEVTSFDFLIVCIFH